MGVGLAAAPGGALPGGIDWGRVAGRLAGAWGVPVAVAGVRQLSAGASRLSWALELTVAGGHRAVVVQRERVRGLGNSDVTVEARLLRAAADRGVPVPEVLLVDPTGDLLDGAAIVTSLVEGETVPRRILRRPDLAGARVRFAEQCGAILARIHAIPASEVGPLDHPDPVGAVREMMDATADQRPAFELGLRWLEDRPPPSQPATVVHGDFRNGNLIVGPSGINAVLDWELAHVGDPVEDLGWLCMRAWRWGAPGVVGGMGDRPTLLDAYRRAGGSDVDDRSLRWWELLATVKWGVMCLAQARTHLSGEYRSAELALLGRQAVTMEYEVLEMLP